MVVEHEARLIVLRPVDDTGLKRGEHLVVTHRHAVAAERIHHVDEHRVAHHPHLEALEVVDAADRPLGVVHVAGARIHPCEADQIGRRVVGDLVEQLLADRAVDHRLHMRGVAEQERQAEDVEVRDHRSERADTDPDQRDRADLRLLDRLLFAAELHRGVHLNAEAAVGRLGQRRAHVLDGLNRRIALRMNVGRFEDELVIGRGKRCRTGHDQPRAAKNRRARAYRMAPGDHDFLPAGWSFDGVWLRSYDDRQSHGKGRARETQGPPGRRGL